MMISLFFNEGLYFRETTTETDIQKKQQLINCIKLLIIWGAEIKDSKLSEKLKTSTDKDIKEIDNIIKSTEIFINEAQKAHGFASTKTARDFLKVDNSSKEKLLTLLYITHAPSEICEQIFKEGLASTVVEQSNAIFPKEALEETQEVTSQNRLSL